MMRFSKSSFENLQTIGVGKESTIYSAECSKLGGATVAIKVYIKSRTSDAKLRAIKREANLMQEMLKRGITSITHFLGAFTDEDHICIVMEYCPRGDLLDLLLSEDHTFSEARVAHVATSLLSTLQRMHQLHLIHRDVKLENIFITDSGELKLGDFGLTMSTCHESAISPVGTSEYMAPEVVRLPLVEHITSGLADLRSITPCTSAVDIWALGITLYELLSGHLPYEMRDKAQMKEAILRGELRPLPYFISPLARSFLGAMLQPDVQQRATAEQLLEHAFLKQPPCTSPRSVLSPVTRAANCTMSSSPPEDGASARHSLREKHALPETPSIAHPLPNITRSPWTASTPAQLRNPDIYQAISTAGKGNSELSSTLTSGTSKNMSDTVSDSTRGSSFRCSTLDPMTSTAATRLTLAFRSCGGGASGGPAVLPLSPEALHDSSLAQTATDDRQAYTARVMPALAAQCHSPASADNLTVLPAAAAAQLPTPDMHTPTVAQVDQNAAQDTLPILRPLSIDDPCTPFHRGRVGWDNIMTPSVMGPYGANLLSPYAPAAISSPTCGSSDEDSPMGFHHKQRRCLSSGCSRPAGSPPPWMRASHPLGRIGNNHSSSCLSGLSSSSDDSSCDEVLSWRRGGADLEDSDASLGWSPVRFLQQLSSFLVPTYVAAAS